LCGGGQLDVIRLAQISRQFERTVATLAEGKQPPISLSDMRNYLVLENPLLQ